MQGLEAAVEGMGHVGGPPRRSTQRLQPNATQPAPSRPDQYLRLKRRHTEEPSEPSAQPCEDDDSDNIQMDYIGLRDVCQAALKANRATDAGQQEFFSFACTFVEAFGLCFDDCYDDSSCLQGAPAFEQRVTISMQVCLVPLLTCLRSPHAAYALHRY